jgi:hypothetical protein
MAYGRVAEHLTAGSGLPLIGPSSFVRRLFHRDAAHEPDDPVHMRSL